MKTIEKVLLGVAVGAAAGFVAGLLMSEENRNTGKQMMDEAQDKLQGGLKSAKDKLVSELEKLNQTIQDLDKKMS